MTIYYDINNTKIVTISDLRRTFPMVSISLPTKEWLNNNGYAPIQNDEMPDPDATKVMYESGIEVRNGIAYRKYALRNKTDEELAIEAETLSAKKREKYAEISDPVFFKWQRGEATKEDWLAKVEEVDDIFS